MTPLFVYYTAVGGVSFLLFILALREIVLLGRIPRGHHERGLYWFNSVFLVCASIALMWGGYYLDGGRREFEEIFIPPPEARYAFEQNSITRNQVWVYESNKSASDMMRFYREYAGAQGILLHEDKESRMSFVLSSGNLFLTIKTEGEKSLLYFSREGKIEIATGE